MSACGVCLCTERMAGHDKRQASLEYSIPQSAPASGQFGANGWLVAEILSDNIFESFLGLLSLKNTYEVLHIFEDLQRYMFSF